MKNGLMQRLRAEIDLIQRFSRTYAQKFERLIDNLNRAPDQSEMQSVRLCVEAVNMMIVSQSQMAGALKEIVDEPAAAPARQAA